MLLILWEANAMGVVLEEEDGVKLRYLTSSMTTSRMPSKMQPGPGSCRGRPARVVTRWRLPAYWLAWYVLPSGLEDGLDTYIFL